MSSAWTKFGGVALTWPPHAAWTIISRTAAVVDRLKHRVYLSPYSTLERCENTLEHIKTYIQGISPERRQKIQTAAERGVCLHLVDVERELERCVVFYSISPFFYLNLHYCQSLRTVLRSVHGV